MLSYINWLTGVFTCGIVLFGLAWGFLFLYKSYRTQTRLLFYMGFDIIFAGLIFLTLALDFLTVLIFGTNLESSNGILSIFTWMWVPPTTIMAMFVAFKLLQPNEKKLQIVVISSFIILGVIFEIIIFSNPLSVFNGLYPLPGEGFYDDQLKLESPATLIISLLMIIVLIYCGFGYLYKSFKSEGIIRKKYLFLSLVVIFYVVGGIVDGLTTRGVELLFVRFGIMISFWFWYWSLKEETEKPKEFKAKKDFKVKDHIFIISKMNPEEITEAQVTFYRNQKICLICKGKVRGFNFMCSKCDALYCQKCAQALEELENACWVCNEPINPNKPTTIKKIHIEKEHANKVKK
ncbi:MAG: membrane protein of unknown function [Promethearchaeota archaeon]|nr:MAG: membrane protein of unknown function [Candidatus Lokiarchaeota archaeon]